MSQIVKKAKIPGIGSYVPETLYTNEYLESLVDINSDRVELFQFYQMNKKIKNITKGE